MGAPRAQVSAAINEFELVDLPKQAVFHREMALGIELRTKLCALVILVVLASPPATRATEASSRAILANKYLPDAGLIDQAGKPVSFAALKGKPLLVGFIHTSCQGICEMLTAKMVSIAKQLDPSFGQKVTMVSVTTDPKEDGPAELAAYAKKQGAVGSGWLFLTGQRAEIVKILKVYNVPEGDPDGLIHVQDLYLISANGREVHHYNGAEVAAPAVAADIRALRR
jgi:protein SCO1/2